MVGASFSPSSLSLPRPLFSHRVAASSAQPVPVAPPPTTRTSKGASRVAALRDANAAGREGVTSRRARRRAWRRRMGDGGRAASGRAGAARPRAPATANTTLYLHSRGGPQSTPTDLLRRRLLAAAKRGVRAVRGHAGARSQRQPAQGGHGDGREVVKRGGSVEDACALCGAWRERRAPPSQSAAARDAILSSNPSRLHIAGRRKASPRPHRARAGSPRASSSRLLLSSLHLSLPAAASCSRDTAAYTRKRSHAMAPAATA